MPFTALEMHNLYTLTTTLTVCLFNIYIINTLHRINYVIMYHSKFITQSQKQVQVFSTKIYYFYNTFIISIIKYRNCQEGYVLIYLHKTLLLHGVA